MNDLSANSENEWFKFRSGAWINVQSMKQVQLIEFSMIHLVSSAIAVDFTYTTSLISRNKFRGLQRSSILLVTYFLVLILLDIRTHFEVANCGQPPSECSSKRHSRYNKRWKSFTRFFSSLIFNRADNFRGKINPLPYARLWMAGQSLE